MSRRRIVWAIVALYLLALASGALNSVEAFISGFGLSDAPKYHISLFAFLPGFIVVSMLSAIFSINDLPL